MIFGWMRKRREEQLRLQGLTVEARALTEGASPRPNRLIQTDMGYGRELWADYGQTTRFRKQGRMVVSGKLVLDPGDPKALAAKLRLPLERKVVRF